MTCSCTGSARAAATAGEAAPVRPWETAVAASSEGHLELVQLLVARGADVNQRVVYVTRTRVWSFGDITRVEPAGDSREVVRTALSEARAAGHIDVINFLIAAGARD